MSSFPNQLYVTDREADFATHQGSAKISDVVIDTDEPTEVAVYRLVEVRRYVACSAVRRLADTEQGAKA